MNRRIKVGVITLNGYFNYGNRLQNYALCSYLNKIDGVEAENIWYNEHEIIDNKQYSPFTFIRKYIAHKSFREKFVNGSSQKDAIRKYNIRKFNEKYIPTRYVDDVQKIEKEYDYFVVGSDQIWHPEWADCEVAFLQFAQLNKRIAYSASIGVSEIPEKNKLDFTKGLKGMRHISVREEAGAAIVKKLTGKEAPVLLDPTMLISREEWANLSVKPFYCKNERYLLMFFLGGCSDSRMKKIKQIARENNLSVIDLSDVQQFDYYVSGVEEWLYLIHHAALVATDSFHGTVFSIIMGVPFINYPRYGSDQGSRIDTLLSWCHLENRRAVDDAIADDLFNNNYEYAQAKIIEKQQEAKQFLLGSLSAEG